ncbi:type III restriction-modification system endonuclease [Paratractidigestivibacter faecalis]|uniref:DEAD/DEAH box helicase family protein n=1 Tax=Paratractidigestivibacter faecalis TaxID=2292441 RepID=A0ABV1IHZ1_9ACTN
MKFKFKVQKYQTDAADAVCDVFEGQSNQGASAYLRDLGRKRQEAQAHIEFDEENAEGYANAPLALGRDALLTNVRAVQRRNQLPESTTLFAGMGACQLDVEMETGTGKTYVYTKTMLELNRRYGWCKFIVVVPSVAIREGVAKSLENTRDHFFEHYQKSIRFFIYNSDNLTELDAYSQSDDVSCMIINMQAFNASMKEGANNKAARIIFDERDEFGSRRPIDVIAANRPIVICDEPQKMGKKGSATQKGIARFKPLFVLSYSATHKEKHDLVYALDALDAYNQKLVKRIEVKGFALKNMRGTDGYLYLKDIVVSKNRAPEAVIEFKCMGAGGKVRKKTQRFCEGDSIYDASGSTKLEAYRTYTIASGNDGVVPAQDGRPGYVRFLDSSIGDDGRVFIGELYNDSAADDIQRIQIRETIKSHLQKEEALFRRGIKCLSLFFIDEVAKYRDLTGNGETVGYGKVFEEEYSAIVDDRLKHSTADDIIDPSYAQYLARDDASAVHDGYFSIDKKGGIVESKKEKKSEREDGIGINDDDAKRGYDLILKDKERLLSLDEPVRFIFSHSALREGWDNPNIFQICTLKESGSETSKRQEVGRGMRLAVDQDGNRQDAGLLGADEVHRVNLLTVIASESYETFVRDLQTDIGKSLRERPKKVDMDLFSGHDVVVNGETVSFTSEQSKHVYKVLYKCDFIDDDDKPTDEFRKAVDEGTFVEDFMAKLPEGIADAPHAHAVEALVKSVYDAHALDGMIGRAEEKITENALTENFARHEFKELWARINHKHAYTVSFSDEELRGKAIARINADLRVNKLQYTLTTGGQKGEAKREELARGDSFARGGTETHNVETSAAAVAVSYDLVGEVARGAAITRRSAAAILSSIDANVFGLYRVNPEEFIKKAAALIVSEKATMVVEHISYHEIDDVYDEAIFTERMPDSASRAYEVKKGIQRFVFPDSDGERRFAEDMDAAAEVAVYAKLPRTFQIPTPVGNYAPDWAIAFKEGSVRHVFFVAETKGTMDTMELSGVENAKIACAKKLFNEMSTSDVRYHNVATYDDLLEVMGRIP